MTSISGLVVALLIVACGSIAAESAPLTTPHGTWIATQMVSLLGSSASPAPSRIERRVPMEEPRPHGESEHLPPPAAPTDRASLHPAGRRNHAWAGIPPTPGAVFLLSGTNGHGRAGHWTCADDRRTRAGSGVLSPGAHGARRTSSLRRRMPRRRSTWMISRGSRSPGTCAALTRNPRSRGRALTRKPSGATMYGEHVASGESELAAAGLRLADLPAGDTFLDLAAGTGGLSLPAARLGAKVLSPARPRGPSPGAA